MLLHQMPEGLVGLVYIYTILYAMHKYVKYEKKIILFFGYYIGFCYTHITAVLQYHHWHGGISMNAMNF